MIAFPEIYLALQQGLADGWESPINTFYDSKNWEVGKPGYITRKVTIDGSTPKMLIGLRPQTNGSAAPAASAH